MREDEKFVIESVAAKFGGTWRPGEDPPDAYLVNGDSEIAIEISTLTQHITDDRGTRPRISDDTTAVRLADELNAELEKLVPDGMTVGLVLKAPINQFRKTKAALSKDIQNRLSQLNPSDEDSNDHVVRVNDNEITIFINRHGAERAAGYKKISGIVFNRNSNPDILLNATMILGDRIRVKTAKCANVPLGRPLWLVLLNDYFLTDPETYRMALASDKTIHPFRKILVVNRDKSVHSIYEC